MAGSINWVDLEIAEKGLSERDYLRRFFVKYLSGKWFPGFKELLFLTQYNTSSDKAKFLFDKYLDYLSISSYLTLYYNYSNEINFNFDIKKLLVSLNRDFKKFDFTIKHIKNDSNKLEILFLSKINENKIFKRKNRWDSGNYSDTFLITLYKNRILLKDFNRVFKKNTAKKFIEKFTSSVGGEISIFQLNQIDFKKFLKKISAVKDIKSMEFISEKVPEAPIMKIVARREIDNIINPLKNFIDQGYIESIGDVKNFSIKLPEEKVPLYINIEHKLKGLPDDTKAIKLKFSYVDFGNKALKVLDKSKLSDYYIYFEKKNTSLKEDIELLTYKKQLNLYEETWYKNSIKQLLDEELIDLEKKGEHSLIDFNLNKIFQRFEKECNLNGFKIKKINLSGLKRYKDYLILDLDVKGAHFLLVFFFSPPSESLIQELKNKWVYSLFSLDNPPLFVLPSVTKYEEISKLGDYPVISLTDFLYSFFDKSLSDLLTKKTIEIHKIYRQTKEKAILKKIKEIDDIIQKKDSANHQIFEEGMYYLHSALFNATNKIGGGYIPDGIKISIKLNDKSDIDIWDAKIWFSNFDKQEEIDKMAKYIISTLREPQINSIGEFKRYFFIGHLENPKVIEEMFKKAKEEAWKISKRFKKDKITKKGIDSIEWKYVDFYFYKEILEWVKSKDELDLFNVGIFKNIDKFFNSTKIFNKSNAESFINSQNDILKSLKSKSKINIKNYRKQSKEVFVQFNKT